MMQECFRCHDKFSTAKSTSFLKLSYCTKLCEVADIGFDVDQWLRIPVKPLQTIPVELPVEEPVVLLHG
jgi:hypothetical protein